MNSLKLRLARKRKKPVFLRQNWFRFPSLGKKWRAAKGNQNKLRMHRKGKGFMPHPGYGSPKAVKGLHPSGLEEVRVFNKEDLSKIDAKKQCARIAASVGNRKYMEISKKASEKGIRILNQRKIESKEGK